MLIRIPSTARAALPLAAHAQEFPYDRNHRTAHRA